jgi:hypothetical protein
MKYIIKTAPCISAQIPWEIRPTDGKDIIWRFSKNPVIKRDLLPTSNSIFNSAVVPYQDGFAGVFRCDDTNRRMRLHVGFSNNGIDWNIEAESLKFENSDPETENGFMVMTQGYALLKTDTMLPGAMDIMVPL